MAKKKTRTKPRTPTELMRTVRGSWNGVNPVTKIERDRTKYTRKEKHKGQNMTDE